MDDDAPGHAAAETVCKRLDAERLPHNVLRSPYPCKDFAEMPVEVLRAFLKTS